MARRKNRPEATLEKSQLSNRLRGIRIELFGERGGSEMARRLGLPVRTWYNYESGVTVPAEVLLRFLELTQVEPIWLLHGREPRYRTNRPDAIANNGVRDLLKSVLAQLTLRSDPESVISPNDFYPDAGLDVARIAEDRVSVPDHEGSEGMHGDSEGGPPFLPANREGLSSPPEAHRCVRITGDAMIPILADGAYVAYADNPEELNDLTGSLVVAWIDGNPIVRWYETAGRYGILRAENSRAANATYLLELDDPTATPPIRRVLWTSTPHP